MWHDMFVTGISYGEKTLRTILVYAAIVILLRLAGKRELAQLNTLDLAVVMLLSNVVQNAVIGNDNSLVGGVYGATVLITVNALFVRRAGVPQLARAAAGAGAGGEPQRADPRREAADSRRCGGWRCGRRT